MAGNRQGLQTERHFQRGSGSSQAANCTKALRPEGSRGLVCRTRRSPYHTPSCSKGVSRGHILRPQNPSKPFGFIYGYELFIENPVVDIIYTRISVHPDLRPRLPPTLKACGSLPESAREWFGRCRMVRGLLLGSPSDRRVSAIWLEFCGHFMCLNQPLGHITSESQEKVK